MTKIILGLFVAFSASTSFATAFKCKDDRGGESTATLEFKGTRLITATVRKSGIKNLSTVIFNRDNSDFSKGRNSEQTFQNVTRDITEELQGEDLEASLSYKIEEKGKRLTLEESLVGPQHALNGEPYGKLRFDFTIPGLTEDYGWTYFYYCEVK